MSIKDQLMSDMKQAMRDKNKAKLAVVRQIKGEITKFETSKQFNGTTSDDDVKKIIRLLVKQHVESHEAFLAAARDEDAQKEMDEMTELKAYLPQAVTGDALVAKVKEVIAELGVESPSEMGKVMGHFKASGIECDGKELSVIVKNLLS